jgi:hypothetical protein
LATLREMQGWRLTLEEGAADEANGTDETDGT